MATFGAIAILACIGGIYALATVNGDMQGRF
jgi:hypothetical protein